MLGKALAPGKHTIVFDFKYDGPGPGKGGTGVLTVDGKEIAKKTIPHTIPILMSIDESFDIGSDTRTGVDDSYKLPFTFTGTIDKLTYKLGPNQMTAAEKRRPRRNDSPWSRTKRVSNRGSERQDVVHRDGRLIALTPASKQPRE